MQAYRYVLPPILTILTFVACEQRHTIFLVVEKSRIIRHRLNFGQ